MSNLLKVFIKNVEICLTEKGWKKKDLAKKMGVKPSSITRYLGGENCPTLDKVEEIAIALGVDPATLLKSGKLDLSSIERRVSALESSK